MSCYSPLEGFRSSELTKSGKRKLVFSASKGFKDLPVTVACGQCIGCRLERSRQWAMRLVHENQLHELSVFVTLTYSDDKLPPDGGLRKSDFQKFMKRLRKQHYVLDDKGERVYLPLRYFHCGEYGDETKRPHYHAILFGVDFPDKTFYTKNAQGDTIYRSETLNAIWGHGECRIGSVTFETAAYTARYILKKVTGEAAEAHYARVDPDTGEIYSIQSEYITMSLKPAIGADWYRQFKTDVFPDDAVILRGRELKPPRYYYQILKKEDESLATLIKLRRVRSASAHKENNTPERLRVRKEVKEAQISTLKRKL